MKKRRSRSRKKEEVELNITAFMNLMVVLVPFLLMTAVFSQMSIFELNLPGLSDPKNNKKDKPDFNLQVIIRPNKLVVADDRGGMLSEINDVPSGHNYQELRTFLKRVKATLQQKNNDRKNITILAEQKTDYDSLIQVMNTVRMYQALDENGEIIQAELFPDISIGDAPR